MNPRTDRRMPRERVDKNEALRRMATACACFAVGDTVDILDDSGECVAQATVAHEYGCYEEFGSNGIYVASDGLLVNYRYGYIVRINGDDLNYFVPPHRLTRADGELSYLRLATDRGRAVEVQRSGRRGYLRRADGE